VAAVYQLAEQEFLGQRTLDELLNDARHRPRTHLRIVAALGDPAPCRFVDGNRNALLLELRLRLDQDLVDHALDGVLIQAAELDDGIQAVADRTVISLLRPLGIRLCGSGT